MAQEKMAELTHEQLWHVCQRMPNDEPCGKCKRLTATLPALILSDLSGGCKWFHTLGGPASLDWGVCGNPQSHRGGLLTFEHQGCPKFERVIRKPAAASASAVSTAFSRRPNNLKVNVLQLVQNRTGGVG